MVARTNGNSKIVKSTHQKFWSQLCKKGWNKTEPGEPYPSEKPRLFEQTLYRALGEDFIGESKAAELLSIPTYELAARRRMEMDNGTVSQ